MMALEFVERGMWCPSHQGIVLLAQVLSHLQPVSHFAVYALLSESEDHYH